MGLFETFPYVNFQDLNLNTLLQHMRELLTTMKELETYVGGFNKRISTLEWFIDRLERGNFPPSFTSALYKWLNDNVPDILSNAIQMVWFGLTDNGYFVAYIPESWNDIIFNTTGLDIVTPLMTEYGHLTLSTRR